MKGEGHMSEICPICNSVIAEGESVCSACGYRILGSTQSFKPLTLDSEAVAPSANRTSESLFKIVRGPQTGIELPLKPGKLTIGRDPHCDVFLNDMTVSRHHATVEIDDKKTVIIDENSFNGVWVNNHSVTQRVLANGDVIQIGEFCLLYQER